MSLGEKILDLRKKKGMSQEQLGEKIDVTRQTISNWELNVTAPNPEQLKLLSKELDISIDELLDNDIKNVLESKISNTEKLAGLVIKILKVLGILIAVFLVIDVIAFILFAFVRSSDGGLLVSSGNEIEFVCTQDEDEYVITVGNDGYFNCSNCSKELYSELKDNYIDYSDLNDTFDKVSSYFEKNNGICE